MKYILTDEERETLKKHHRKERDGRVRDRLKVVLLRDMGWSYALIAEALFLDEDTVGRHLKEYQESRKLKTEYQDAQSKLMDDQTSKSGYPFHEAYLSHHKSDSDLYLQNVWG